VFWLVKNVICQAMEWHGALLAMPAQEISGQSAARTVANEFHHDAMWRLSDDTVVRAPAQ